ncbi:MAG TPA: TonB C-terminal domain-containing protein [Patescibacteria group bacterium]|jgi:hypothetical protein|nr:TonB C-terminal domain-containing protein [Patescibacteria group bacterium]
MLPVERTENKKQTVAFIIACVLNVSFLFLIFLSEFNQNVLFKEHIFYENDTILDLLPEESEKIEEKSNSQAGLMTRGTPDGTTPPSLFSENQSHRASIKDANDHNEQIDYKKSDDQELVDQATEKTTIESVTGASNKEIERETSNENQYVKTLNESSTANLSVTTATKKIISRSASKSKKNSAHYTPSLAQMTRNALQTTHTTVQTKGNAAIFMSGDPNKLPSELQLIEEYYWAKMEKVWRNSFTLLQDQLVHSSYNIMSAIVELFYQSDGYIKNVSMIRSSGNNDIDEFIMNVFAHALPSFPPKPTSLRKSGNEVRQCTIYLRMT